MLLTDPPYNVAVSNSDGLTIQNDNMGLSQFNDFLERAFKAMVTAMKAGCPFYVWYASRAHISFEQALNKAGLDVREQLIWNKNTFTLGRQDYQWKHEPCLYGWKDGAGHYFCDARNEATVIPDAEEISPKKMNKDELVSLVRNMLSDKVPTTVIDEDKPSRCDKHPTMKPIRLMARLIRNSSRKGDLVLDVFGGSGSTLVACEQMGRRCYTMELDARYCDVILERWEAMTGETAVLEEA